MSPDGEWGWVERLLDRLLRLYPVSFRERYGVEMLATFSDRWREERGARRVVYLVRTLTSVFFSALWERIESGAGVGAGVREQGSRSGRGPGRWLRHMRDDIRYALRGLKRHPAFTVVVLATLALGIGMNTAVFSVLYGALYAPLPYGNADEVVRVGRTHPSVPGLFPLSNASYQDMREAARSLSPLEAVAGTGFVLTGRGDAAQYAGARVTPGFFDLLQVRAARGRTFTAEDAEAGAEAVAVISHALWETQLGADPGVIGSTLRLNDVPHTVIGILPEDFTFSGAQLWTPLRLSPEQWAVRGSNYLAMYARLKPGATPEQATAELAAAWAPIRDAYPRGNEDTSFGARRVRDIITQANRSPLMLLAGAAAFVLLIACANVANLLLVRAERRQREVGVRAALGAAQRRLAGLFLTEGIITSVLGGVLGVGVAWAGLRALVAAFGNSIPRAAEVGVNVPVLVFSLVASMVTGLLVGVGPALRRRPDFRVLREGGRGGTARTSRMARVLVVAEVALAIMLVTGAGLLLKSYAAAIRSDLGFDPDGVVAFNFWFPSSLYPDGAGTQQFMEQLLSSAQSRPELQSAAAISLVPIREFGNNYTEIGAVGRETKASFVENRYITPGFFEAMGVRILRGRTFTDAEARDGGTTIIINETLARQLFGDDEPLGQALTVGGSTPQIIGVVADTRDFGPDQLPRPTLYRPSAGVTSLLVRSSLPTGQVANVMRGIVRDVDPAVAVIRIEDMPTILDKALSGRRFQLTLIGVFAITALVLACVGIYGVLSYSVERQTREIGVRMALGAHAARVAGQIAWRGGRLALLGVVVGIVGAFGLKRTISTQLFDVQAFDPGVYFGVGGLVMLVATLACLVPARRAAVIDPVKALNME